jgi:hypothetical protein
VAQGGDEGRGFPVPVRRLVAQPRAAFRPSPEPQHVGFGERFVDEYKFRRVQRRLLLTQDPPCISDIRPILLGRVHGLFLVSG